MHTVHKRVADVLKLLASKDAQAEYQRSVPIADVHAELLCMWFDDLGEAWQSNEFSPQQRDRLQKFHAFYEARSKRLPRVLEELHKSPVWNEVMVEAKSTLDELGWPSGS